MYFITETEVKENGSALEIEVLCKQNGIWPCNPIHYLSNGDRLYHQASTTFRNFTHRWYKWKYNEVYMCSELSSLLQGKELKPQTVMENVVFRHLWPVYVEKRQGFHSLYTQMNEYIWKLTENLLIKPLVSPYLLSTEHFLFSRKSSPKKVSAIILYTQFKIFPSSFSFKK